MVQPHSTPFTDPRHRADLAEGVLTAASPATHDKANLWASASPVTPRHVAVPARLSGLDHVFLRFLGC